MAPLTRLLADYAVNLRFEVLPQEVVRKTKELVLDHCGVVLYGATQRSGEIGIEYVSSLRGVQESTVIGSNLKVPAVDAAFANGISAHSPELDDTENLGSIHPGTTVIPAALAVGEKVQANGRLFITAIAAGYDVAIRLAVAAQGTNMSHYNRGFHPTATCGTFGAAAAAGVMIGLDTEQMTNAFGIAGSSAAGLLEFLEDGTWAKRFGAGRAAADGVTAALMARLGFTGPGTVIEGKRGFLRAYSDDIDASAITAGLGKDFAIMRTGIKPHSCCRYIQAPLDATLQILRETNLSPDEIRQVEVGVVRTALAILEEPSALKYEPKTVVDAQFSVPYGIATVIIRGRAFIDEYTEEAIGDGRVLAMAKKVKLVHDSELDKEFPMRWPARVSITLNGGEKLKVHVSGARGDPEMPLTGQELEEKFSTLAGKVLTDSSLHSLLSVLRRIETVHDIGELTGVLRYRNSKLEPLRNARLGHALSND